MKQTLIIEGEPVAKPRMTQRDKWAERPCVVKYFSYRDMVRWQTKRVNWATIDKLESVKFCLPMPKSWSKKKKLEMNGKPHQQKPDIDNLLKGLLDALMVEDKMVYYVGSLGKWWSDKPIVEIIY